MEDNNVTVTRKQRVLGIILCLLIFAAVGVISYFICKPMLEMSKDPAAFRAYIDEQGVKGYLMLMVAMFLQVVVFHHSSRRDLLAFIFFLIPGTPKDIFTYVMGFTDMKIPVWIFITFVGRFPAILLSAMSGDAIGEKKYTTFIIMIVLIVVVCIAGSIFYTVWKKKHDAKEAAEAAAVNGAVDGAIEGTEAAKAENETDQVTRNDK